MTKGRKPHDPRDLYVRSEKPISLTKLTKLYKGKNKCGYSTLKDRCSNEGWVQQRIDFHREATAKLDQKIIEKKAEYRAKNITELNEEHDLIVQELISISKSLLKKYIKQDADGKDVIDCDAKDFRALVTTQIELLKAQRLFHNYDPVNPVEQATARKGNALEKLFGSIIPKESKE